MTAAAVVPRVRSRTSGSSAGGDYFRRNEIWRTVIDKPTGDTVGDELVKQNCALVKYLPTGVDIVDVMPAPEPAAQLAA